MGKSSPVTDPDIGFDALRSEQRKVVQDLWTQPARDFLVVLRCGMGKTARIFMLALLLQEKETLSDKLFLVMTPGSFLVY